MRGDRLKSSESDVYRRQILTTKVDPRAVRVKHENLQMFGLKLNKSEKKYLGVNT